MNNMLSSVMNSLVVRNNDIHYYTCNTRQNHHLRGSRPTCKTVVNSFTNRSFQIWNAISSQVNINVSLYKFKYNVKLFLLYFFYIQGETLTNLSYLMFFITTNYLIFYSLLMNAWLLILD